MDACDKAVDLAVDALQAAWYRVSRGVARALTGDEQGATEDFVAFVSMMSARGKDTELVARRIRWIESLKAGTNPLTATEVAQLVGETATAP